MKWLARYWKWIALGLGLVALSVAVSFLPIGEWVKTFTNWIRGLGVAGAFIFIGVYGLASVLFLPGAVFTIAAGLVYGIVGGTAVALAGATLGAGLAFLVARYVARSRIKKFAQQNKRFGAIDQAVGEQGWKIVGLLRLSPLIPFNVSNYFYGLTSISFWPYLLVSCIGMLPGTLLYAYLGAIGQAGLSGGKKGHSPLEWTFLGIGLLATIAVTVFVSRVAKKALQKSGATKKK
ncbi:MAG: TVP38/TMEM64 family protein [Chthoniobacterales bacterium]|nr:TVP38/TMEM64 family protein [Chthoniobacterales bacterium]